jgi:hypothetical protein
MKYVVAERRLAGGEHPIRVIVSQKHWPGLRDLNAGWVKLFETETVAEAEALEALLQPAERVDKNINRS